MDFDLTEEQQAVVEVAEKLLRDKSTPERLREVERDDQLRFDRELWAAMAEGGLLGSVVPESAGGAGLGIVEACLVLREVGRRTAAVPALPTLVGGLALARFGGDAETERLAALAAGDLVIGLALTEALGDPTTPATTAVVDGDVCRLTGTKTNVLAGLTADLVLVTATGSSGPGVFVVDPAGAGVTVERQDTTSGTPEARLVLDGAAAEALGPDDGTVLTWLVEHATVGACAVQAGVCAEAIRMTGEYTTSREQFGRAIATFQAVGQRAADAYVDTQAIDLTMLQAAWRLGAGHPSAREVAVAKYWASDGGHRVTHAAQHLHGGIGVDRDYPLHRYFLLSKQLELTLGGASRQLARLGALLADDLR